jgi:hypothetical protein
MAQKRQRGWLKKENRLQGETWVLYFRTTRKSDGRKVENLRKLPRQFQARQPTALPTLLTSLRITPAPIKHQPNSRHPRSMRMPLQTMMPLQINKDLTTRHIP